MGNINRWFDSSEFACKCGCGFCIVSADLLEVLNDLRDHFGKPVILNCVCRCPKHNRMVGGKPKSQHLEGKAADIRIPGVSPKDIFDYIEFNYPQTGLHQYNTFVHVDVRGRRARW